MSNNLNKEFFQEILQRHYNDKSIEVNDLEVKSGIGKGENYGSTILRARLNWENGTKSGEEKLVLKTVAQHQLTNDTIDHISLFKTENEFYKSIVPLYKSIIKEMEIDYSNRIAPEYLVCENPDLVILEDLAPLGFRLGDRQNGGDLNHALLLLKALARNQALSITINRTMPEFFNDKLSTLILTDKRMLEMFFVKSYNEQIENLKNWPEFSEFVGRMEEKSVDDLIDLFKCGKLKSICQGDCWMNNMLFRYEDTIPVEVCLIDYQAIFWGSLVYDVTYFLYSSISPDVLEKHKKYLIDTYIEELHKWMKDLGQEIGEYTRENILKDFQEMQYLGVIIVMSILYIITCDPKDALDLDNFDDDGVINKRNILRNKPLFKKKLLKHLQLFAKDNVI